MIKSGAEISPNDIEAAVVAPPDWFLKRRARLAAQAGPNSETSDTRPERATSDILTEVVPQDSHELRVDSDESDDLSAESSDVSPADEVTDESNGNFVAKSHESANSLLDYQTSYVIGIGIPSTTLPQALPAQSVANTDSNQTAPQRRPASKWLNISRRKKRVPNKDSGESLSTEALSKSAGNRSISDGPEVNAVSNRPTSISPERRSEDGKGGAVEKTLIGAQPSQTPEFNPAVVDAARPKPKRRKGANSLRGLSVPTFSLPQDLSGFDAPGPDAESVESLAGDFVADEVAPPVVVSKPRSPKLRIGLKAEDHTEEDEVLTPFQVFTKRYLGSDALGGYALSGVIHLLIALVLSLLVLRQNYHREPIATLFSVGPGEGEGGGGGGNQELDDTVLKLDATGMQANDIELNLFGPSSVDGIKPLSPGDFAGDVTLGGSGLGAGGGEGEGTGKGIGDGLNVGGFQMPEGGKAISKGSFTVWTVPADPLPRQPYLIIIQVKYKKPNQKLNKSDISGMVQGTDKFRLAISEKTTRIVPEANQVVLEIPGAAEMVQDTIDVRSNMLRESQKLKIVF